MTDVAAVRTAAYSHGGFVAGLDDFLDVVVLVEAQRAIGLAVLEAELVEVVAAFEHDDLLARPLGLESDAALVAPQLPCYTPPTSALVEHAHVD